MFSTRIAMSRSHIAHPAARGSRKEEAGHEPAAGSRPAPFRCRPVRRSIEGRERRASLPLPVDRWGRITREGASWGGAAGVLLVAGLGEASDGCWLVEGGGRRRRRCVDCGGWASSASAALHPSGLVVSKRYRRCKPQDMPNYCRCPAEKYCAGAGGGAQRLPFLLRVADNTARSLVMVSMSHHPSEPLAISHYLIDRCATF